MNVDGRAIAKDIYTDLHFEYAKMPRPLRLGIVMVGADPVVASFVKIKTRTAERLGVAMEVTTLPQDSTTEAVVAAVHNLTSAVDGIIVQLPLPEQVDIDRVLAAIPRELDIDGINPNILEVDRLVHAPVAEAVGVLIELSAWNPQGRRAVVVGAGRLVGTPVAALLSGLGTQVSVVTREAGSLQELKSADIIVLGAGNPGFVTPDMIAEGVILIDAGTSESNGKMVGDADPACAPKCTLFTPVPGGVGPIAVAMIFKNLLTLAKSKL
jgi:methylenetetrahydrofolate dehydrogenase (NADP+)/methenyltetrahydrofolate cyclohydrolase